MAKITLDMDFGNEAEFEDEVEIPKQTTNKTDDEKKEYIAELINEGLKLCQENADRITELIEKIDMFKNFGLNQQMMEVLYYLESIFTTNLPDLLRGNFEELIPEDLVGEEMDRELLTGLLKVSRKDLLKAIEDNRENK